MFREYQQHIGTDLCFQSFEEELKGLPGRYSEPGGTILLAESANGPAGVVALRPLTEITAEMKRLYVRPAFHGSGLGRRLAEALIDAARERRYTAIRLDTLPTMERAIGLYRNLGFLEIEAYTENPVEGARFMELTWRAGNSTD
jgi:ribosomal protein S18 acetylase RimI-like enzyme